MWRKICYSYGQKQQEFMMDPALVHELYDQRFVWCEPDKICTVTPERLTNIYDAQVMGCLSHIVLV